MINTEEISAGLEEHQKILYTRYCEKGYSQDSALYLALLFGQTRTEQGPIGNLEFTITNPELYIRTHLGALLAWNEFNSPGILRDSVKAIFS